MFVNAVLVRELHHLLHHDHEHHHHAQGIECDAEGSDFHFHHTPEEAVDCLVCAYQFSTPQKVETTLLAVPVLFFAQKNAFAYQNTETAKEVITNHLRGPPAFFSFS